MKPYIHTEKTDPSSDTYFGLMSDLGYYAARVAHYAAKCEALAFEKPFMWKGEDCSTRASDEKQLQLNIERVNKAVAKLLALETASVQQSEAAE
jgi:hypothetical protein